jgi:DNA-directed RNA polymerase subunit alpha
MIDLKVLMVEKEDCDAGTVQQLRNALQTDKTQAKVLRDAADTLKKKLGNAQPDAAKKLCLKLGISLYFLGHGNEASQYLAQAEGPLAAFYLGRLQASAGKHEEAFKSFEKAEKSGYNAAQVNLQRVGLFRETGKHDKCRELLEKHKDLASHSAEYHYQNGRLLLDQGHLAKGAEAFEAAIKNDPGHAASLFQLGRLNDIAGNDDDAIAFYERCRQQPPVHAGTLTNLGILYEDQGRFEKAFECFRQVQVGQPANETARLLARDAQASISMVVSADGTTAAAVPSHIFEVSIFDFELSVRARNCLKRLNIKTIGDLTRVTEDQLLNNRNFGETSLDEVKKILDAKNLRLGQSLEAGGEGSTYRPPLELTEAEQIKLAAPTSDLQLSVRARKCMSRLALNSIGELVAKSADELLEARNFGITSLNEVREKLRERGLALRGE